MSDCGRPESARRGRRLQRVRRRLRAAGGQTSLEYGALLVVVAAMIGTLASLGLPTALAHAVSCEVQQLELNSCRGGPTAANPGSGASAGSLGTAGTGRAALEQALGSKSLIDACAGGPSPDSVAEQRAPDSAACKQQVAKLSPKSLATMALLAAALQAQEPGNRGSFAVLFQSYLQHPGWAVIALSPIAQAQQESGNTLLEKLRNSPGDLADGLLGSLCGGYGICLGGNVDTQAYQQAWHTSAQINKITTPILYATGISAIFKGASRTAIEAILARLSRREAEPIAQALGEMESKTGVVSLTGGPGTRFIANSSGDVLDVSRVTIPEGKYGYLLDNPSKSGVFTQSMGFDRQTLEPALREHLLDNFGDASAPTPMVGGGTKFTVTGPITGPSGETWNITTVWGVDPDGTVRLITATPAKRIR